MRDHVEKVLLASKLVKQRASRSGRRLRCTQQGQQSKCRTINFAVCEDDTSAPPTTLLRGGRCRIKGAQTVRRDGLRKVVQRQGLAGTIVVIAVAGVMQNLEIVDHHHGVSAATEHNVELFGEWKIVVPVGVEVEE